MFFDVVLDALIATSKGFFPCIGITKCSWSKRLDFTNVQTVLKQHTVCPADLGPVVLLPAWVPSILEGKLVDIQSPLFFLKCDLLSYPTPQCKMRNNMKFLMGYLLGDVCKKRLILSLGCRCGLS